MDFLFGKDRTPWVFRDKEATKIGAIFERDLSHGEALTVFDKSIKAGVEHVDRDIEHHDTLDSHAEAGDKV